MKRIILTAIILALTVSIHGQSNTVQIEYFLDTDNGIGMNTVLDITSPDIDITETILADIPPSTSIGYHKLYIRAKDADNNWSQTTRKNIEIFASVTENNIVMGEYFVDEDPEMGIANTFAINPQEVDIQQAFTAQILGNIALGYHKLYGRVKDSNDNWSHTFRKNIEVYLKPDTNIVEIEYFFGDDGDLEFGNNSSISISVPEVEGTWTFNVPYPTGSYNFDDVLFLRVKDSNENWSITTILDEIGTLGVGDNLLSNTSISPNPFDNDLTIKLPNNTTIQKTEIYNTLGQTVYSSLENKSTLNLSNLKSGIYILNLKTDLGSASLKIVKK